MDSGPSRVHRDRAASESRKAAAAKRQKQWDRALRHNRAAVRALEQAVTMADHDDDRLDLAGALGVQAELLEASGDGTAAVSAAREALKMYETVDRDLADPARIPGMLTFAYGVHPRHGPLKARFEQIFALVADAHFHLARLIAEHDPQNGDAEARRLAAIGLETYRALVSAGDRHSAGTLESATATRQRVLDLLSGGEGGPSAEELTRQATRERAERGADTRHHLEQADSLSAKAQRHYAAGRFAEAVGPMREAVALYRTVAEHSLWHKRLLARALYDFAHHLEGNDERGPAVATMREALLLFRQVHEDDDDRFGVEVLACRREVRRLRRVHLHLRPRATRVPPMHPL